MASRVQKIMFWDTFKNAKSVILHYFPVAEIGSNIHLLYFSYPQEILAQFVEWGKKVLSPYRPHWSVYFSVSLLQIAGEHPVDIPRDDQISLDKTKNNRKIIYLDITRHLQISIDNTPPLTLSHGTVRSTASSAPSMSRLRKSTLGWSMASRRLYRG